MVNVQRRAAYNKKECRITVTVTLQKRHKHDVLKTN